jgi:hypothetical protein
LGKITITLTDETEKTLRAYVTKKYPKQSLDKLGEVVEKSVVEYLEKQKNEHIGSSQTFYSSP